MPVILHVDPSTADREMIRDALSNQENWTIEGANSYEEARERLQLHPVDAILSEVELGDGYWNDLVSMLRSRQMTTPVFVVTAQMTVEGAAQAVRDGAETVLLKGSNYDEWPFPIECAIDQATSRSVRASVEKSLSSQKLLFVLENEKGRVPHLVNLLVEQCDRFGLLDDRDRMRIQVALEEAILNSIIHGNLEVSSKLRELEGDVFEQTVSERKVSLPYSLRRVILEAEYNYELARFTIRDEGPGFDVNKVRNPTEDDAIELASGRGILLMRSFMDETDYNDKGNEVRMLKRRSASLTPEVEQLTTCAATITV
ncbi:MAG: response regulator [Planctomycetota bacterium]|nr:MAG: response regulator [Planctomycetota bacterium]